MCTNKSIPEYLKIATIYILILMAEKVEQMLEYLKEFYSIAKPQLDKNYEEDIKNLDSHYKTIKEVSGGSEIDILYENAKENINRNYEDKKLDFEKKYKQLQDTIFPAIERAEKDEAKQEEYVMDQIEHVEFLVTMNERLGLDSTDLNNILEDSIDKFRAKDYDGSIEKITETKNLAKQMLSSYMKKSMLELSDFFTNIPSNKDGPEKIIQYLESKSEFFRNLGNIEILKEVSEVLSKS